MISQWLPRVVLQALLSFTLFTKLLDLNWFKLCHANELRKVCMSAIPDVMGLPTRQTVYFSPMHRSSTSSVALCSIPLPPAATFGPQAVLLHSDCLLSSRDPVCVTSRILFIFSSRNSAQFPPFRSHAPWLS